MSDRNALPNGIGPYLPNGIDPPAPEPEIIEESYWPNIIPHILDRREDKPYVRVQCPTCMEELMFNGLPEVPGMDEAEPALVFPCGHMLCDECRESVDYMEMGAWHSRCPTCRQVLSCSVCGKVGKGLPAYSDVLANTIEGFMERFPYLMPYEQGFFELCSRCTIHGEWIVATNAPQHALLPEMLETVHDWLDLLLMQEREGLARILPPIDVTIFLPRVPEMEIEGIRMFLNHVKNIWVTSPVWSRELWA